MRRPEMQFRTRSKIIETKEGYALTFGFRLGPIAIFAIANLPEEHKPQDGPLVYIKLDLRMSEDWQDSTEYISRRL